MARIRTIKPDFFKNEELSEMSAMNRLLFIGLWTQADREGRLHDRPKRLKAEIFPYENFDVDKGLQQLHEAGFIIRYKVNVNDSVRVLAPEQPKTELAVIEIVNFLKHQKIDKANEKQSELPERLLIDERKTSTSLVIGGEGKGKEGKEGTNFMKDLKIENCILPEDSTGFKVIAYSIRLYEGFKDEFPNNKDLPLKTVSEWVKPVRNLIETKKYDYETHIKPVLLWALNDSFWKSQILDAEKLDKHFEKLKIQYQNAEA